VTASDVGAHCRCVRVTAVAVSSMGVRAIERICRGLTVVGIVAVGVASTIPSGSQREMRSNGESAPHGKLLGQSGVTRRNH
jgi:hypothetical protein